MCVPTMVKFQLRSSRTRTRAEDVLGDRRGSTKYFVAYKLPDGSVVEVFGPSDEEHASFDTGPVAGFQVDDSEAARARLEEAGTEFIGSIHRWEPGNQVWSHFRAPDGNVYELTQTSSTG
jgi:hypothetical protein